MANVDNKQPLRIINSIAPIRICDADRYRTPGGR
jgi:hypothetical protein